MTAHLAGTGLPLLPGTYYVMSDQEPILLFEIELGERAAFDLFHADDMLVNGWET